jgi:hypothetical protein
MTERLRNVIVSCQLYTGMFVIFLLFNLASSLAIIFLIIYIYIYLTRGDQFRSSSRRADLICRISLSIVYKNNLENKM